MNVRLYSRIFLYSLVPEPRFPYTLHMSFILSIQAVLAVLIIFGVLLQHRSSGLSVAMGGTGVSHVQRRGAEKFLYDATVVCSAIFFVLTVVGWFI